MTYLLFRTNLLVEFVNEYNASANLVIGGEYVSALFNPMLFIAVILVILITVILFAVMHIKKKPLVYYIFTVVANVAVFVVYNVAIGIVRQMEYGLIDARISRGISDILLITFFVQLLNVILTFIRATGFDIKKFNFKEDLQQLEIDDTDNEEFEFEVKLDTRSIISESKRRLRFMKYIYVENRIIIDGIILLVLVGISYLIYLNLAVYNKYYSQGKFFDTQDFTMQIESVHLTNKNAGGQLINDNYFVLLRLNVKSKFVKDLVLNTGIMELEVGDDKYYHSTKYKDNFGDIGNVYLNSKVPITESETVLLIYEIPASKKDERMYFRYINDLESTNKFKTKYLKTRLEVEDLSEIKTQEKVKYNEDVKIDNSVMKEAVINITEIALAKSFELNYEFCVTETFCYQSKEIVRPKINTNYDKAIMRIRGSIKLSENFNNNSVKGLFSFLKTYANVEYDIDGREYKEQLKVQLIPANAKVSRTLFIEVNERVMKAENIRLQIGVRNNMYEYVVK